jgi:uncharacterized protein YukE
VSTAAACADTVEIPKGDPGALGAAAEVWAHLGERLSNASDGLSSASAVASGADWHGAASAGFSLASLDLQMGMTNGAEVCRTVAAALRGHAHELRDAQRRARRAARAFTDARQAERAARADAARFAGEATTQALAAGNATSAAAIARAAGPAGAPAAAAHDAAARAAAGAAEAAGAAAHRAELAAQTAADDATAALKAGRDAYEDAERAGRRAAAALGHVAGAFPETVPTFPAPVPITLRGPDNPLLPGLGSLGGGLVRIPSDVRRAQIADAERRAEAAAEAAKPHKGSIFDGLAGLVNSASFGLIDPPADKDSDRYRGGTMAGLIPLSPAGVVKGGGKLGSKLFGKAGAKEAEKVAARGAAGVVAGATAVAGRANSLRPGTRVALTSRGRKIILEVDEHGHLQQVEPPPIPRGTRIGDARQELDRAATIEDRVERGIRNSPETEARRAALDAIQTLISGANDHLR